MKTKLNFIIRIAVIIFLAVFASNLDAIQGKELAQTAGSSGTTTGISAPDASTILPPSGNSPIFGQDHSYSVVFRGNGEAVVTLRVSLTNNTKTKLDTVSLRIPKVEPTQLASYQIILEKVCVRYAPQAYDQATGTYKQGDCLQYQEPNYFQGYFYQAKYQKADVNYKGDTITVTLPQPLAPNTSGAFFLYYRAFGYAKKDIFGAYNYTFETLKVEDSIRDLKVGISTDSDLVLKGVRGNVNYRYEAPTMALNAVGEAGAPVANTSLDTYIQRIGYGVINKTASNLSPLESYTVKGAYSTSNFRLYAKPIVIGIAVFLFVIVVLLLIARKVWKMTEKKKGGTKDEVQNAEKPLTSNNMRNFLLLSGISFISSILIAGYTVCLAFVSTRISSFFGYQYDMIFILFFIVISFCVYSVLLFGPAIYLGYKKGLGWGVGCAVMTIFWLFIFLIIGVGVMFMLNPSGVNQPPVPLLYKNINPKGDNGGV